MELDLSQFKLLFVDDEKNILKSIRRELYQEPYEKLFANSGKEALEILKQNPDISVVISDVRMPEMNGLELLSKVKKLYPNIVRIVLTGYTEVSSIISAINSGEVYKYLTKPWKLEDEFIPIIRVAINIYYLMTERKEFIKKVSKHNIELNHKNREITQLKQDIKKAIELQSRDFQYISKKVSQYIKSLLNSTAELSVFKETRVQIIAEELYNDGIRILELIEKFEKSIKNDSVMK